ncbi:hypothetical protein BaRGS_00003158, partial [Batillaria attramentaria]
SHYADFDGFVVLHGTDTMSYTASALSFMCENLGKPIIFTGAQIPIYEVRSDGRDNFLGSLIIAGNYNIPEVLLCFNEKVFRGNRSVKSDCSSFTAFESPNMPPLVSLEIDIRVDWPAVFNSGEMEKFRVHTNLCQNVGILRLFPGITSQTVRAFLKPPMQGVVVQTYGAGNAPSNRADLMEVFSEATKWGVLILNTTQCNRGNVNNAYATGKALENAGLISGGDMTAEAALCKLSYVLGKDAWSTETRRKMLSRNLRGEMTAVVQETMTIMDHDLIEGVARTLCLSTHEEVDKLKDALFPSLMCAAAKAGDIPALEKLMNSFLLGHGASVHARDNRGDNPLIDAIMAKSMSVIDLLVQTGAKLPWTDSRIAVHLCSAAAVGDVETIKAWTAAGANLNNGDYDSRTPLHIAVNCNKKEVVKYLVECNARCNLQDVFGLTAVHIAQKLGHTDLVELMCPSGRLPTIPQDITIRPPAHGAKHH